MHSADVGLLRGTFDLFILKTLSWGPMHGLAVLHWIERVTKQRLQIEEGALYPALHRMEARGLIEAEWGLSENNRKAKFYRLTVRGRRELRAESESWTRYVSVIGKVMSATEQPA